MKTLAKKMKKTIHSFMSSTAFSSREMILI
jgi:hypothetical protein